MQYNAPQYVATWPDARAVWPHMYPQLQVLQTTPLLLAGGVGGALFTVIIM